MLKALLISLLITGSLAQQAQRSPYSSQFMYYFYSKADDMKFKDICDKLGIGQGKLYLILGKDTVQATQVNDSLKLFRGVQDVPRYLGRGVEDHWIIKGINTYVKFKEFYKP